MGCHILTHTHTHIIVKRSVWLRAKRRIMEDEDDLISARKRELLVALGLVAFNSIRSESGREKKGSGNVRVAVANLCEFNDNNYYQ